VYIQLTAFYVVIPPENLFRSAIIDQSSLVN